MKIRKSHIIKPDLISKRTSRGSSNGITSTSKKSKSLDAEHLHHLAFDNSLLANLISIVNDGTIISVNRAACKLLGYSKKMLLTRKMKDIFNFSYSNFKKILEKRETSGHAIGNLIIIKKDGKLLPCQITSVVFTGDHHIKKAITTLVDRSESIRLQKNIDLKKEKQVAADIIFAKSKADDALIRLDALEHELDKEITAKEKIKSSSHLQQMVFEKEMKDEIKLKGIQIADAIKEAKELERSDLGKELHDNVNQLLATSRLYLDIARKNNAHREAYLNRSSEYTMSAIEEIRKLTKGLINDVLSNLGLRNAIHNLITDIMEAYPVKIFCVMDSEIHTRVNAKFNLNVFRIVQEQLNNIIKHAKASVVRIGFSQNKTAIILSISDNGSGFDPAKKGEGIGIANINSRAAYYKGSAHFNSKPGKGCVLTVTFPVTEALLNKIA